MGGLKKWKSIVMYKKGDKMFSLTFYVECFSITFGWWVPMCTELLSLCVSTSNVCKVDGKWEKNLFFLVKIHLNFFYFFGEMWEICAHVLRVNVCFYDAWHIHFWDFNFFVWFEGRKIIHIESGCHLFYFMLNHRSFFFWWLN